MAHNLICSCGDCIYICLSAWFAYNSSNTVLKWFWFMFLCSQILRKSLGLPSNASCCASCPSSISVVAPHCKHVASQTNDMIFAVVSTSKLLNFKKWNKPWLNFDDSLFIPLTISNSLIWNQAALASNFLAGTLEAFPVDYSNPFRILAWCPFTLLAYPFTASTSLSVCNLLPHLLLLLLLLLVIFLQLHVGA